MNEKTGRDMLLVGTPAATGAAAPKPEEYPVDTAYTPAMRETEEVHHNLGLNRPHTVRADDPTVTPDPDATVDMGRYGTFANATHDEQGGQGRTSVPPSRSAGPTPTPASTGNGGGGSKLPPSLKKVGGAGWRGIVSAFDLLNRTGKQGWLQKLFVRGLAVVITVFGLANAYHFSVGGAATWAWSETWFRSEPAMNRMWRDHFGTVAVPLIADVVVLALLVMAGLHLYFGWKAGAREQRELRMGGAPAEVQAERKLRDRTWRAKWAKVMVAAGILAATFTAALVVQREYFPFRMGDFVPFAAVVALFAVWSVIAGYTVRTFWRATGGGMGRMLIGVLVLSVLVLILGYFNVAFTWEFIKRFWQFSLLVLLMFGLYQAEIGLLLSGARTVHADVNHDDLPTDMPHATAEGHVNDPHHADQNLAKRH